MQAFLMPWLWPMDGVFALHVQGTEPVEAELTLSGEWPLGAARHVCLHGPSEGRARLSDHFQFPPVCP